MGGESALVSLTGVLVAFLSDLAIVFLVFLRVPLHTILHLLPLMFSGKPLTGITLLTGFAGSFLAFSGLESISQLAPVMKPPRKRTVRLALLMVVLTIGITSPLLTIFATTLVDVSRVDPNQLISIPSRPQPNDFHQVWRGGDPCFQARGGAAPCPLSGCAPLKENTSLSLVNPFGHGAGRSRCLSTCSSSACTGRQVG